MVVAAPPTTRCAVTEYARDVVDGNIVTGQYVRLACERHLRDLELGSLRGLWFDQEEAERVFRFFRGLKHSKGVWAGRPFELEAWQKFIVGSVFGWKRADGSRRFRTAHSEVARKNGKTTLVAGAALYATFADGEAGAEGYIAATKRDQARICWDEAMRMVRATDALRSAITVLEARGNLSNRSTNSKLEPLARDADSLDGLNPHFVGIDELHAHPNRDMVDVLETAVGARRQPLIWYITTAGFNQQSIWWEKRSYAINVLDGLVDDDRLFVYIATLDKGDDWRDASVWVKSNPNMGVSIDPEELASTVKKAESETREQNNVRTKRLNQPTSQASRWINMDAWDAGDQAPKIDTTARWFVGFDFAETVDLSAAVAVSIGDDGYLDVLCRFWRPEDTIVEAEKRDGVSYRIWADQGFLTLTEGTMMSNADVADDMIAWVEDLGIDVREVPIDRFGASGAAGRMELAGLTPVTFPQNYEHFTAPCHHLEGLWQSRRIRHGGNPVLRWMAAQMEVMQGPNDAVKPYKAKGSGLRNDGIVALLMALGRALAHEPVASEPSIIVFDWIEE